MNMVGQKVYNHQFSSVPDSSSFEIVQSELAAKYTFKIDKYNGTVYQLVKTKGNGLAWEIITNPEKEDYWELPEEERLKANYQLMLSGIEAKYTFLLNVNTGRGWQLTEDKKSGALFWSPIASAFVDFFKSSLD